jgi:hypothetical protein
VIPAIVPINIKNTGDTTINCGINAGPHDFNSGIHLVYFQKNKPENIQNQIKQPIVVSSI